MFLKILRMSQRDTYVGVSILIKLQSFRPATSLKRDPNTGVFLWNSRNFLEHLFWRNICKRLLLNWSNENHGISEVSWNLIFLKYKCRNGSFPRRLIWQRNRLKYFRKYYNDILICLTKACLNKEDDRNCSFSFNALYPFY